MSRAFVKEDDDQYEPVHTFALPAPNSPGYAAASAIALLEAARDNITSQAEEATGYQWAHADLIPHVRAIVERLEQEPFAEQDRRLIQVARRFLRDADPRRGASPADPGDDASTADVRRGDPSHG